MKIKITKKELIAASFFLISMSVLVCFFGKRQYEKSKSIEQNLSVTIGKVFFINDKRNFTDARYYFYFNGNKYESGKYIKNSGRKYLGKYYKVEFSIVEPKFSRIYLDYEIKDSAKIINAGF